MRPSVQTFESGLCARARVVLGKDRSSVCEPRRRSSCPSTEPCSCAIASNKGLHAGQSWSPPAHIHLHHRYFNIADQEAESEDEE